MVRDLVIHSNTEGVEIALLEDRRLVEFYLDRNTKSGFIAGDIYLGRVRKINPGLNAAFIDIGHEKDAFIHYSDLSPNFRSLKKFTDDVQKGKPFRLLSDFEIEPEIEKNGSIDQLLVKGDMLIFQILKEAISTKGPRLSCEITIPGRYLVLTPFINNIGISRKLDIKEERKRLMALLNSIRQKTLDLLLELMPPLQQKKK
ncbi:MAG: ribonuclease E/G [Bacteroidetes bacterium]|nr:ribonuclease E/G [Bacteroidota bacterium]